MPLSTASRSRNGRGDAEDRAEHDQPQQQPQPHAVGHEQPPDPPQRHRFVGDVLGAELLAAAAATPLTAATALAVEAHQILPNRRALIQMTVSTDATGIDGRGLRL